MNPIKRENGFTLIEVLAVIIIIAVLGAVAIPKLVSSTANARQKADVATGHQVKAALDRYQLENGTYPTDLTGTSGVVSSASLIPKYISKLDTSTTQQAADAGKKGFGVASITAVSDPLVMAIPDTKTNIIMIYMNSNDLVAEVQVYDQSLATLLWTSAN